MDVGAKAYQQVHSIGLIPGKGQDIVKGRPPPLIPCVDIRPLLYQPPHDFFRHLLRIEDSCLALSVKSRLQTAGFKNILDSVTISVTERRQKIFRQPARIISAFLLFYNKSFSFRAVPLKKNKNIRFLIHCFIILKTKSS